MAEILLARLVGPQGFERPVVIKRILPHLQERPQFLTMMADEARIAARIQHPNVVRIHELLEHEALPHIVMEFLPGESLAALLNELEVRKEGLQLALALHVVAEAAAGLHAAHELREPDGTPLHVVHRDVSPHNVFITDEGSVKLLDFGIVKASARMTKTATGQLKGKYRYLAPEQCHGKPLDRRADIFALGVVLYEATTGTRLFERDNELLTLKAIMMDPIPPPSRVRSGYPKPLEKIVMKALARDPAERFQTADELRQKLVGLAMQITGPVLPDRGLRGLMRRVFRDRIDKRAEMLRRLAEEDTVGLKLVDPAEVLDRSRSGVILSPEKLLESAQPERKKQKWLPVVGALVAGIALVSVGWVARGGSPEPAVVEAPPPEPEPEVEPEPVEVEPIVFEDLGPEQVSVEVHTSPEGAEVRRGTELLGVTPLAIELDWSEDEDVALSIALEGYSPRELPVLPDENKMISLELRELPSEDEPEVVVEEPAPVVQRRGWRGRRRPRTSMATRMVATMTAEVTMDAPMESTTRMGSPFRRFD